MEHINKAVLPAFLGHLSRETLLGRTITCRLYFLQPWQLVSRSLFFTSLLASMCMTSGPCLPTDPESAVRFCDSWVREGG